MKFSISYPMQGTTKIIDVDDDNKCRVFFERRMGNEVQADTLGDQYKGYVFKICGGFDLDGFSMKQGIFVNGRVRLLLSPGSKGYRGKKAGQRKRKSVRGCIVGPDIRMLSVTIVKKGQSQIPGLTDVTMPRRLGPKRASGIRKLYGIQKGEKQNAMLSTPLLKKHVTRRTFKSKKNPDAHQRNKAPKIQRLVTDVRLRRKKIYKETKMKRWRKTLQATAEYKKLYDNWITQKKLSSQELKKIDRKLSKEQGQTIKKGEKSSDNKKKEKKVPIQKEKKVEVKGSSEITGAHVKASITRVKKVVKQTGSK